MNMLGKIRRLRFRDGLSISEICRRTGLARNTVKRWLKAEKGAEPRYRRKELATILTPYEDRLRQWLEADARRAKRDRRTALALFGQLQPLGFTGSYTRVSEYVRRWRRDGATASNRRSSRSSSNSAKLSSSTGARSRWSSAAFTASCSSPTSSCAPVARSCWWPTRRRVTKCSSIPTPGPSGCSAAFRSAASTTKKTAVDKVGRRQAAHHQYALCRDGRAPLVRPDFCNVAIGLGERRRRKERAGQPSAHLAGRAPAL